MNTQSNKNNKRKKLLWIIRIFSLIVAFFIGFKMFSAVQLNSLKLHHFWFLPLALLISFFEYSLGPLALVILLRSMGQIAKYYDMFLVFTFSSFASYAIPVPTSAFATRSVVLKHAHNISYTISASLFTMEMVIGNILSAMIALICGVIWVLPIFKEQFIMLKKILIIIIIFFAVIVIFSFILGLFKKSNLKIIKILNDIKNILINSKKIWFLPYITVLLLAHFATLLRFICLLNVLGVSCLPGALLTVIVTSYIAGLVSLIPLGIGVRDVSLASFLILLKIPPTAAMTATVFERIFFSLPYLIGGVISTHYFGNKFLISQSKINESID